MKSKYSISVVIPVYNEADLIEDSVYKINNFLKKHFFNYQIIIVESGSTDGTAQICDRLSKRYRRVKVVHEGTKKGYGSGLRIGFQKATYDLVLQIPPDIPFPITKILTALPFFEYYECVLSYRSKDNRNFTRKLQSLVYNLIAKTVFGIHARHVNSAFKIFKREIIQKINLDSNGWFLDTEIIFRIEQKNIPYIQMGVPLIEKRKKNSWFKIKASLSMFSELILFNFRLGNWIARWKGLKFFS